MNVVLFVKIIDQIGGTEVATQRLARTLRDRGIRVTLLSTQGLSQWAKRCSVYDYTNNIDIVRLPVWQRSPTTFAQMLKLHLRWIFPTLLRNAQIIHLRSLSSETIQMAQQAHHHKIKTLCVPGASGDLGDAAQLPNFAQRQLDAFDWISALTPAMQAEISTLGFPPERTSIIPNGVDPAVFTPAQGYSSQASVLFIGQPRPEKRVDLLLQAWQQVQARYPQAALTLIGGQNPTDYRQMATQLGITPHFKATISPATVPDELRQHSILVMPGTSEGMSNALLEAMATGLAPVVSDTPANCAVVTNGVNGLTYASDSPQDLAAQLIRLLEAPALREQLGAAARATVLQHFNLDRVAEAYIDLYRRLLSDA